MMGMARLNRSYPDGADVVGVVVDLINACGLSVDEAQLRKLMRASVVRRGHSPSCLRLAGVYNAGQKPARDEFEAFLRALGLLWRVDGDHVRLYDEVSVS
jgi:hypothetical protein